MPERRKRYTSSREEEDVAANMCPCGTAIESVRLAQLEIYKEERNALVEGMRKSDVCDMVQEFSRVESREKMIDINILGDRWWPQTAIQDGDRISKRFLCSMWNKHNERPNVGGVSIRSRNGAPSRKGCVVNGQMTQASNKRARPPLTSRPPQPTVTLVVSTKKKLCRHYKTNGGRCLLVVYFSSRLFKSDWATSSLLFCWGFTLYADCMIGASPTHRQTAKRKDNKSKTTIENNAFHSNFSVV